MGQNWHPTSSPLRSQEQDPPKAVVTLPYVWHLSESVQHLQPLGQLYLFMPLPCKPLDDPSSTWRTTLLHNNGQVWFTRSLVKHAQRHTLARGPHLRASVKGAQDGTCSKRDQSICSSWACSGRDLWHSVDVRHSCRQSPHFHQLRCTLEAWHIWSQDNTMNRYAAPLPSVYNPLIHPINPAKWLGIDDIFTLPHSSFYPWILGTDLLYVLVTVFDSPPIHLLISHLWPFHPASAFPPPSLLPPAL